MGVPEGQLTGKGFAWYLIPLADHSIKKCKCKKWIDCSIFCWFKTPFFWLKHHFFEQNYTFFGKKSCWVTFFLLNTIFFGTELYLFWYHANMTLSCQQPCGWLPATMFLAANNHIFGCGWLPTTMWLTSKRCLGDMGRKGGIGQVPQIPMIWCPLAEPLGRSHPCRPTWMEPNFEEFRTYLCLINSDSLAAQVWKSASNHGGTLVWRLACFKSDTHHSWYTKKWSHSMFKDSEHYMINYIVAGQENLIALIVYQNWEDIDTWISWISWIRIVMFFKQMSKFCSFLSHRSSLQIRQFKAV